MTKPILLGEVKGVYAGGVGRISWKSVRIEPLQPYNLNSTVILDLRHMDVKVGDRISIVVEREIEEDTCRKCGEPVGLQSGRDMSNGIKRCGNQNCIHYMKRI